MITLNDDVKHVLANVLKVGLTTALLALITNINANPALFGTATGIISGLLTGIQVYYGIALPTQSTPTPTMSNSISTPDTTKP